MSAVDELIDGALAERLLLERERLLSEDVKAKMARLKQIEDELKDIVDKNGGQVVSESMGITLSYQHRFGAPEWDMAALMKVIRPEDAEALTLKVENKSVQALVDTGRYTEKELAPCAVRKPQRGPLIEKPLRRSL